MSNTAAITASVLAANASAQAQAQAARVAAKKAECRQLMPGYRDTGDAKAATAYAECVQLLHPPERTHDPDEARVIVAAILLCVLAGVVLGWYWDRWTGVFIGAIAGLGLSLAGALTVLALNFVIFGGA